MTWKFSGISKHFQMPMSSATHDFTDIFCFLQIKNASTLNKDYAFFVNSRSKERCRVIESSLRVPLTNFFFIYKFGTHTESGNRIHTICAFQNINHQYAENAEYD